jgi:hypothetical protein
MQTRQLLVDPRAYGPSVLMKRSRQSRHHDERIEFSCAVREDGVLSSLPSCHLCIRRPTLLRLS